MRPLLAAVLVASASAAPAHAGKCDFQCDGAARDERHCCLKPADFAARRKACDASDPEACVLLSRHLGWGVGAPNDGVEAGKADARAQQIFVEHCDKKDGKACVRAGELFFDHFDGVNAMRFFERACDLGVGDGCRRFGWAADTGEDGVKQDAARARALYSRGCDLDDAEACNQLGLAIEANDAAWAQKLYEKSCKLGGFSGAGGCERARKYETAVALYLRACDLDNDGAACAGAAQVMVDHDIKVRGGMRYDTLMKLACERGFHHACHTDPPASAHP
jgi:TPR repeat protein